MESTGWRSISIGLRETSGPTNLYCGTIADGEVLKRVGETIVSVPASAGVTDHGALTGLGDDDHIQYALAGASRVGTISVELNSAINQDVTTDASPTWVTAKLTGLTDGYIPYHVNDSTGLADGPLKSAVDSAVSSAHAAVTLVASAAVLMDLTGQAISLDTQTANYLFVGPTTGAAAAPTFRAMVDADLGTGLSPTFVTVKLTGLTDGYVPYHVSDAAGLGNTNLWTDGANFGLAVASAAGRLEIEDGATAKTILLKITQDDANVYGLVIGNDTYSATDTDGLLIGVNNSGLPVMQSTQGTIQLLSTHTGTNSYLLHIKGPTPTYGSLGQIYVEATDYLSGISFYTPLGTHHIWTAGAGWGSGAGGKDHFRFIDASSGLDYLLITTTGEIGIFSNNPSSQFELHSNTISAKTVVATVLAQSESLTALVIGNVTYTATAGNGLCLNLSNTGTASIYNTGAGDLILRAGGTANTSDMYLQAEDKIYIQDYNAGTPATKATWDVINGRLGIGMAPAAGLLQVGDGTNYTQLATDGDISMVGTARIMWSKKTAASVTITVGGTDASSVVANLQTENDGNIFHLDEATGAPGIDFYVEFTSITAFNWVRVRGSYVGSATHAIGILIYDWVAAAWKHKRAISSTVYDTTAQQEVIENKDFFIADDASYIGTGGDAGKVRIRFVHPMGGNASHDIYMDCVVLYQ